ncbi:hypothetical protein [Solibacillus sp. NPDC093137]|uniref:hypothetical protein n=1 Tax=Solibacillus sp. NPDC093137 TaxID=3390678 RepID=UPI003D077E72
MESNFVITVGAESYTLRQLELVLARFYKNIRMKSATHWDMHRGKIKTPIYPTSSELMEIFGTDNWQDICKISENNFMEYKFQHKLSDYYDVTKALNKELHKQSAINILTPYKYLLENNNAEEYKEKIKYIHEKDGVLLPSVTRLAKHFGSWNAAREYFGVEETNSIGRSATTYDKEALLKILKESGSNLTSSNWNKLAPDLGLPSRQISMNIFTPDELYKYTSYRKKYTSQYLLEVAWEHREHFKLSVRAWRDYAHENNLPIKSTYSTIWGNSIVNAVVAYLKSDNPTFEKMKEIVGDM